MDTKTFVEEVQKKLPVRSVINNPIKGTTTIVKYEGDDLIYRRGDSSYRVSLSELADSYRYCKGALVSTSDLKVHKPSVFGDQKSAHACNGSLFLMLMKELGLTAQITGLGERGDPLKVQL